MRKIKFYQRSSYENDKQNNLIIEGKNWSDIVSHLIDITARKVDHYKSDILYDLRNYVDAIEKDEDYLAYLVFRESGVTTVTEDNAETFFNDNRNEKYIYRLCYDADLQLQTCIRMDVIIKTNMELN